MTQPPQQNPAKPQAQPAPIQAQAQLQASNILKPPKIEYKPIEDGTRPHPSAVLAMREQFPRFDQWMIRWCGCCQKDASFANQMIHTAPLFSFEEEFKEEKYKKYALKLKIKGTGSLRLDANVLHPFVRVHVMDIQTWKPLAKSQKNKPGVANRESVQILKESGEFEQKETDFLLPFATQFFDMRLQGQTQCQWNEEFVINELASNLLKPNVVLLFEILELNTQLIADNQLDQLTAELFYPVAWAYLRPLGTAMTHTSRSRLQLYEYKFKYTAQVADDWQYDLRTPAVFLDFDHPRKTQYPSYLEVEIQFCNRSDVEIPRKHFSRYPWEKEIDLYGATSYTPDMVPGQDSRETKGSDEDVLLKRWEKFLDLPSMLPDQRLRKLDTDAQGALRLEFSSKGKYIAVACTTSQKSKTIIKLFDITKDEQPKVILRGHYDLIHDMNWSKDDKFLVSASADGSVKVWDLSNQEMVDPAKRLNYTENDDQFLMTQLMHPSFVYGSKIHPLQEQALHSRPLIIATICFDQKVRIWWLDTARGEAQIFSEMSIMEKPQRTLGQKQSIYELDQLDDEALALIVRPEKKVKMTYEKIVQEPSIAGAQPGTITKKSVTVTREVDDTIFDQTHPNCLVFSEQGRLFVGDSKGSISAWDVDYRQGSLVVENYFKITHKEIEGDQINQIQVHPEFTNQIFVQSRDNCIRLIQYESARGIRIKKRFFGSHCKDMMVRCTISPDGQYIVAGSEDGKPRVWGSSLEEVFSTTPYECKMLDLVSDVVWNPRYNMFALSGFGQHFPVLIYVYQRSEEELSKLLIAGQGISVESERAAEWFKEKLEKQVREQKENEPFESPSKGGLGESFARSSHIF